MNGTVTVLCLCLCVCVQGVSVGRQSGRAVQCTDCKNARPEGCVQPAFSGTDFTSSECIRLNRMAVSTFCATSWHSHSVPQPVEPTFSIASLSFSSLVACTGYLPVQKRIRTCSKVFIKACKTFSSTEPTIPRDCADESDCGGELGVLAFSVLPQSAE
jgi:hypothetical protein